MKPDTYAIEYTEDDKWRLIVLEYIHEDLPDCKSVKDIIESDDLANLNGYIDDLNNIEYIRASADDLPMPFKQIKLLVDANERLRYIRECRDAVTNAEIDLARRRVELAQAINGDFDV